MDKLKNRPVEYKSERRFYLFPRRCPLTKRWFFGRTVEHMETRIVILECVGMPVLQWTRVSLTKGTA